MPQHSQTLSMGGRGVRCVRRKALAQVFEQKR
jgi:hypothetical protein